MLQRKNCYIYWVRAQILSNTPLGINHFFINGKLICYCYVSCQFMFFETGFLCVALAVLELALQTRLASNSACICLPSDGIKGTICLPSVGLKAGISATTAQQDRFFFSLLVFQDRVSLQLWRLSWNSLCRPGWPRTDCLCLPNSGIKGMHHHYLADRFLYNDFCSEIFK